MPRIALVQFSPLPPTHPTGPEGASSENLRRAHEFVRKAKTGGAELVVFPEYFISGIVSDPFHHNLAQRSHASIPTDSHDSSHWLESFRLLALELDIEIVPGTIVERRKAVGVEREQGKEEVLVNVAHYISGEGKILGRYEKENLWHPEKDYLTPGTAAGNNVVFDTKFGRTAMMICWDLAWPESFRSLLESSVLDLVIIPTFWTSTDGTPLGLSHNPDGEKLFLDTILIGRAFENECAIVFVNCGGELEEGFIGGSGVRVPFKGLIGGTKNNEEEMVLVDVDMNILKDAREVYGIRNDLLKKKIGYCK